MGPAGNDPAYLAFQASPNPSQVETRGRDGRNRTSAAWSRARCAAITRHPGVGLTGTGPASFRPPAGRSATDLQPVSRVPGSRTRFPRAPNAVDYRLPRTRGAASCSGPGAWIRAGTLPVILRMDAVPRLATWRRWESNPLRQRLQGATAALAVIPESGPPQVRTGNLRHAMAALCRLELAAHSRRYRNNGRPRWARGRMWERQPVRPEAAETVVESNHKEPDNRHSFDSPS